MRAAAAPLVLAVVLAATPCAAADDLLRAEVERLVWDAVDAPDGGVAAVVADLAALPGVTWRDVHDVLAAGRPAARRVEPQDPVEDPDAVAALVAALPWAPGEVHTYPLADAQPFLYSVAVGPPIVTGDARADARPPAVLFDLGALSPDAVAPADWVVVRLHPALLSAAEVAGRPFALGAGSTPETLILSVLRDLERRVAHDPDRVVLAGHGDGGAAAAHLVTQRPDRFAGVVVTSEAPDVDEDVRGNLDRVTVVPL